MSVYVIGNATVDEYFKVEDLPAKGASIHGVEIMRDLGGKGANQALVIRRTGLETYLVAAVGSDERGRWIRKALAAEGLSLETIHDVGGPSDVSMVLTTADGGNAIVTTKAAADRLTVEAMEAALCKARQNDVLILQGNLSVALTRSAFDMGRRRGMATAFNPSPVKAGFSDLWMALDLVVLNEGEALELTGLSAELAAKTICAAGARSVVVTLGAQGSLLANENGVTIVPSSPTTVVDTTGAGDAFMAIAIASATFRQRSVDLIALTAASRAAAVTVAAQGTRSSFPNREQIRDLLAE